MNSIFVLDSYLKINFNDLPSHAQMEITEHLIYALYLNHKHSNNILFARMYNYLNGWLYKS